MNIRKAKWSWPYKIRWHLLVYVCTFREFLLICIRKKPSLFTYSASYLKRFATIIFSNSSSVLFFLALINSRASLPTKYLCSGLASVIARSITFATSFGDVPFAIVENRFSSSLFINCEDR